MNESGKKQKCPICGKATTEQTKPFCSSRCATIDLGRWVGEEYRFPDTDGPEEGMPMESDEFDENSR